VPDFHAEDKMPTNDQQVDQFFTLLGTGTTSAANLTALITTVFCPPDNAVPPTMPAVGITGHGPNFKGSGNGPPLVGITLLFNQLVTSFTNIQLTELNRRRRLYSGQNSPVTIIGTQGWLQGTYGSAWFRKTADDDSFSHYSKPLSDIPVFPAPAPQKSTKIPAFLVFEFGSTTVNTVSRLLIYLDRYSFIRDLYHTADLPPAARHNEYDTDHTEHDREHKRSEHNHEHDKKPR
jgi:hypothetical protein